MKTILTLKSIEDLFVETELKNWYYEIGTCAFKEIDGGGKMMLVSCDSEEPIWRINRSPDYGADFIIINQSFCNRVRSISFSVRGGVLSAFSYQVLDEMLVSYCSLFFFC